MSRDVENSKNIIEKIKENKKLQYLLIAVFSIVIIFIFISTFTKSDADGNTETEINVYVVQLENRLKETLSHVDGAGDVSIVITVESEMETVLAMETVTKQTAAGTEVTETPVIVNGKPIVLKEKYPKVVGVLIVAQGAKNISVLTKIQQATISLLDIDVNQIEILTMK